MIERSVFGELRREHRMVLARIAALERTAAPKTRRSRARAEQEMGRVVRLLERQFATHMSAEDRVLFPALLEALPETRASITPLEAEHAELRSILKNLRSDLADPRDEARDERIAVVVRDLVDLLRIHIRKEEAIVLSVAEHVLTPREIRALEDRMRPPMKLDPPSGPGAARAKGSRR